MCRILGLIVLAVGLIVLTPFLYASSFEAWTDGLYDAESDDDLGQALKCAEIVLDGAPRAAVGHVDVVVGFVPLADEPVTDGVIASAPSPRAPPTP